MTPDAIKTNPDVLFRAAHGERPCPVCGKDTSDFIGIAEPHDIEPSAPVPTVHQCSTCYSRWKIHYSAHYLQVQARRGVFFREDPDEERDCTILRQ